MDPQRLPKLQYRIINFLTFDLDFAYLQKDYVRHIEDPKELGKS